MRTSKISIYHDFENADSTYYTCRTDTPLHPKFLKNFNAFLSLQMFFFQSQLFEKLFQEYYQSITVWIQIRPDFLSDLIWVQIVCKRDHQTVLEGTD